MFSLEIKSVFISLFKICYDKFIKNYQNMNFKRMNKMSKMKTKPTNRKNNQQINRKAIIWTGSILFGIVVVMVILILINQ
jgi:hypothetical protein